MFSQLRGAVRGRQQGFTLIELLVVVAVVGILGSIAYPSYTKYVQRGKRSQAQSAMVAATQFLQRYYSARGTYSNATLPPAYEQGAGGYDITLTVDEDGQGFWLSANPKAGALEGTAIDPQCGVLSLAATGAKSVSGSGTVAECWK
ncbi:type IV pilin protein [Ideonella livida]|uniref:Type IV pilin protein n=1 Tax=Ideonella livida TaxID=2707176 RepID=A0A7C9TKG2_9BURK|nr:type IV pilin protein [Ideonella livida]NDY91724.1 type IV pilin protein [Ideonella livida]